MASNQTTNGANRMAINELIEGYVSRQEAKERGLKFYFTGKPCKYGHVAERYVDCGSCICCKKAYRKDNKEVITEKKKAYYADNKEVILKRAKVYRDNNKEAVAECQKACRANNKEAVVAWHKAYYANNREALAERANTYQKQRKQTDIQFWLSCILRDRLSQAIKNNQKSGSAVRDLGCSIEFLKQYLEAQFVEGMTWENKGSTWHIDHIEPLCSFDLTHREQFLIACHYTNLRPLFKEDNFKKIAEDRKKRFKYEVDPNYSCLIELDLLEDERQGNQQNE